MDIQTILAIAAKHNNPETEIQYRMDCSGFWEKYQGNVSDMMFRANDGYFFRIKPSTITLNGRELPKPIAIKEYVLSPFRLMSNNYCIEGMIDCFEFKSIEDCKTWIDALTELMGEGK